MTRRMRPWFLEAALGLIGFRVSGLGFRVMGFGSRSVYRLWLVKLSCSGEALFWHSHPRIGWLCPTGPLHPAVYVDK